MDVVVGNLVVAYGDMRPIDGLSVQFSGGSTAVMGPSGSGKSTLLRVIAGMQVPTSGSVQLGGGPVAPVSWRDGADQRVVVIHQDYRLVPFLTVRDNILLAAELRDLDRSAADAAEAIQRVGLSPDLLDRTPVTLSGGQQQRVAIARALITQAPVILADEPTGALDTANTLSVAATLAEVARSGAATVVVATHDERVADMMDRRVHLDAEGALASIPSSVSERG